MSRILALFLFLIGSTLFVAAQEEDPALQTLLQQKTTLPAIMHVVDNYYRSPAIKSRLGAANAASSYKHWKRWEYWWSSRVSPKGEFVNVSEKMVQATGLQQSRKIGSSMSSPSNAESVSGAWTLVGPNVTTEGIGRVDRFIFHPTNPSIIYAGAAGGGLWRTNNAGNSWTNLTEDIACLGVGGIAINPNNTNQIYILTGDGDSNGGGLVFSFGYARSSIGVLKSVDGGFNWKKTGSFPGTSSSLSGYRLVMHPTDPAILFACTNDGLFRTNNGGETWINVRDNGRFFNLKFKPGSSQICYATGRSPDLSRAYFWSSANAGLTWDSTLAINNQINQPTSRVELAVAESNSNVVYLLCGGIPDSGQFKGLYRSDNSGVSFIKQSGSPNILGRQSDGSDNNNQSSYDLTIAISTTSSNTVVVGAIEAWRSLDAGVSWVYRGSGIHSDIHEMAFNPLDNKLWAATDGGMYSSTDNGVTWVSHFDGMSISQFYRMAVSPDDHEDMIGGLQDNGVKQRVNANETFQWISGADGYCVGYDAADASIYYSVNNSSVNKYTNFGANAAGITPGRVDLSFFANMAMHTTVGGAFFMASDTFRKVTNGGSIWTTYNSTSMPLGGWYLQTCPSNGSRIYMAGGTSWNDASAGTLRRSDDGGNSWPGGAFILSGNSNFPAAFPKITCINVNPTNSSQVWVTFGGFMDGVKVYYSSNAGLNWQNKSGSLPNVPVNCVAVDNNNNAYIGTDNGVYRSSNLLNEWVPFYNDLPYVPVTDLVISQANNTIRASTFGRGIWSSDLYTTCPVNVNVSALQDGQKFYEASNEVYSTSTITGETGTKIRMKGGQSVKLVPPFKALSHSDFKANIGACGTGLLQVFKADVGDEDILTPVRWVKPGTGLNAIVESAVFNNGQVLVKLNTRQAGNIELVLTDVAGNVVQHMPAANYAMGKTDKVFTTNGLASGTYYVHAVHNHRWEHLQEVEVR